VSAGPARWRKSAFLLNNWCPGAIPTGCEHRGIQAMKNLILGVLFLPVLYVGQIFIGITSMSPLQFVVRNKIAELGVLLPPATCTASRGSASSIQKCINNASRGDTIDVPVGNYNMTTPLTFPTKSGSFNGSNYITLESSNVGLLPNRRMVGGTSDTTNMSTLTVTASGQAVLSFAAGATGYKVVGLHLTNNLTINSSSDITNNFVFIPSGASDLLFDRMVIHPKEHPSVANDYLGSAAYGFNINGDRVTVQRSDIYDFFGRDGTDYKLKGVVAAQSIVAISNANPTVITCETNCGVSSGDRVQVALAGGGLDGYFRLGSALSADFVATSIDSTHFSLPINLKGQDLWDPTNTRTCFYRWPRMSSITLGNPTTITMSTAHHLINGDKVRPHGLASTLGGTLNANEYTVTVTGSTTFTIPVNTTLLSAYSGSGGYYKAEGSGIQSIGFGIGGDVADFNAINNRVETWYATMQTAGSDASPTLTTTVLASPTPTASDVYVASTTGISVGQLIAMDTTHFDDTSKCPFGGQGGDRPCFAFGIVGSVDSGTGHIHFSVPLKIKNSVGTLVDPTAAILSPGQVNVNGKNPTRINLYYNSLEIPFDYGNFHFVSNGNTSKGVIEGKDCSSCTVEGNIVDRSSPSSFSHTVANQNGSSPWMGLFDVTFRNNWLKSFYVGQLDSFVDYNARNTQGHGLTIDNNLIQGGKGFSGNCFSITAPASNVTITHNTCTNGYPAQQTSMFLLWSTAGVGHPYYSVNHTTGVTIRDNIFDAGLYTAQCYEGGATGVFLPTCMVNPTLAYNGFAKTFGARSDPLSIFTHSSNKVVANWNAVKFVGSNANTLTDWALRSDSPFYHQASDGTDMGVNITTLAAALANNDGFTGGGGGGNQRPVSGQLARLPV